MAIDTQIITGRLSEPDGDPITSGSVRFTLSRYDATDNGVIAASRKIEAELQADGSIALELWPNTEGRRGTTYLVELISERGYVVETYGRIQVGEDGPYSLAGLLREELPPATTSYWSTLTQAQYDAAIEAVELSQAWAEGTEPGGTGTKSAQEHAADAGNQATAAATSAAQAALYDGPKFNTIALMAANDALTDGKQVVVWSGFNGEPETFTYDADSTLTADGALVVDADGMGAGRLISTRTTFATVAEMLADRRAFSVGTKLTAAGFSYDVVSSDEHLTTAGGVKLYVLPDRGVYVANSFDGADIGEKFNKAVAAAKAAATGTGTWLTGIYGVLVEPGTYTQTTAMNVDGVKNMAFFAYGATFVVPSAAITSLTVANSYRPVFAGFSFDFRNNNAAEQVISLTGGCAYPIFRDFGIQANSTLSTFAAIRAVQSDDTIRDTGNFWITFDNLWVRKFTSGDTGSIPIGIDLQGSQNAFRLINSKLATVTTGVMVRNQSATSGVANDVKISLTTFETFTNAVTYQTAIITDSVPGGAITDCRFEAGSYVLTMTGFATSPASPVVISGSTIISSVTGYVSAGSDFWWNSLDMSWTPSVSPRMVSGGTTYIGNVSGGTLPTMAVFARQPANGGSIVLRRNDGTVDGKISQRPGGGMLLDGGTVGLVSFTQVNSISGNGTQGTNLRGVVFPSSGTTFAVTLAGTEPDAAYNVILQGSQDRNYWVTGRTTTGFTINTGSAWSSADAVTWLIIR